MEHAYFAAAEKARHRRTYFWQRRILAELWSLNN
jgi:hypothetical protein